ncbi:phosphate ABC transporter substrate-binding protein [Ignicoccus pacificus DSM 13166]|uniref:Phosphate-binding protein n=1 Tax=Ignicoccus pacificus DSM 13166 TaxID=940294 RepID=A0A977PKF0_9CREN|nr:phosphate ABC transporter substrate-binding protein [Ignicoccus pacificus DSM 13166]
MKEKVFALTILLSLPALAVTLTGTGSSFVFPFLSAAAYYYQGANVQYQATGSGAGIVNLLNHLTDFAASDVPMPKNNYCKLLYEGKQVVHVPLVAGAVVVVYNVPELRGMTLRLNGKVLADIYLGKVKYWDDPEIKRLQTPQVASRLPHKPIIAVHRSDASGTTAVFTTYLSKSSREWARRIGSGLTVTWPVDRLGRGVGAPKNQGVAASVSRTPYSIGYVELAYAIQARLPVAELQNAEGYFVKPTPETISAATEGAMKYWVCVLHAPYWFANSLVLAPGRNSYPIVAVPYMIFFRDSPKLPYLIKFAEYLLSDNIQKNVVRMGYAPLSKALRMEIIKELNMLMRR